MFGVMDAVTNWRNARDAESGRQWWYNAITAFRNAGAEDRAEVVQAQTMVADNPVLSFEAEQAVDRIDNPVSTEDW